MVYHYCHIDGCSNKRAWNNKFKNYFKTCSKECFKIYKERSKYTTCYGYNICECKNCLPYDLRDVCHHKKLYPYIECYCHTCDCTINCDSVNCQGKKAPKCKIHNCNKKCYYNYQKQYFSLTCSLTHNHLYYTERTKLIISSYGNDLGGIIINLLQ